MKYITKLRLWTRPCHRRRFIDFIANDTPQKFRSTYITAQTNYSTIKEKDNLGSLPLRVTLLRGVGLTYGGHRGAGSGKAGRYAGGRGDRATLHHQHQEEGEEQRRDAAVVSHCSSLSKILYQNDFWQLLYTVL